jgi:hypothetical protein
MSLLREISANFGGFSNQLDANVVHASKTTTGSFGLGVLVVPATQTAGSTVAIDPETTCVVTLSNQNYNIEFNAAECYVGRIIQGINKGQGAVTFVEAAPNTITFVDNAGFSVTSSSTIPVIAYTGAYATFICTEADGETATLQTLMGSYGGNPVLSLGASATTATITVSTHTIISSTSGPATVDFVPLFLNDDGLPGRIINVTQVGGSTGSVTLQQAPGNTVTFLSLATGLSYVPTITAGTTSTFVVVSGTPTSVVLRQLS